MSPSANESPRFVVVGNPDDRRVALFQDALARRGIAPAEIVPYVDLIAGRVRLDQVVRTGDIVRIESPGRSWEVERALLEKGAAEADGEGDYRRLPAGAVRDLPFARGEILYPRQWYLGYRRVLGEIADRLAACPPHRRMSASADIAAMFDKPRCHILLTESGVPAPQSAGVVRSYNELIARMEAHGWRRVFVKLAHGSSASGVLAYQTDGERHQATTTVEAVREEGRGRLFNSRRIRVLREPAEIAALVDALCGHRVLVERWLPKAGLRERTFDLRVVVVARRARHTVVRLSRGPMTNLHLLNERAGPEAIRERMGSAGWEALRATCARAMRCFPDSLYAGLDVAVAPDFRRHAVLEVNAFGDLLPGACYEGRDTYETEVEAALSERAA